MENYKIKEPVKLKQRELKDGTISLFLEIHSNGRRRYEFLKLYLVKECTKADKQANARTMELAEAIRARRVLELRNNKYGFTAYDDGKADFFSYVLKCAERATKHGIATKERAAIIIEHLKQYSGRNDLTFNMVNNKNFLEGFICYLDRHRITGNALMKWRNPRPLTNNTKFTYFKAIVFYLNNAVREGIITFNESRRIDKNLLPQKENVEKCYLTKKELQELYTSRYGKNNIARTLFLFGCATGLRFSDITSLKWSNIEENNGRLFYEKKQIKTGNEVSAPLSAMALRLLPKRREGDNGFVFKKVTTLNSINTFLRRWTKAVGITKKITFHSSRHTFATLILSEGADLYTVSKLLGHSDIKTTQVYAKIVDESKNKAIDLLPDFLDDNKI